MNSLKDRKLFKHMGLKILSLLLAILLWLVVMNIDDYSMTRTIRSIPVTPLNGDSITSRGKVYDIISGSTVDIVVKGSRSVVDSLTVSSFTATADLSQLSLTNSAQINVTANDSRVNSQIEISYVNRSMNLTIEDKVTREMPIKGVTQGQVAEGYALGNCSVTPNIIEISGPESIISRVTEVRATVNVEQKSESAEAVVTPQCLDAYGDSLNEKSIEMDTPSVRVRAMIYPIKVVPVLIKTEGAPAADYVITGINYNPMELKITGPELALEKTEDITLTAKGLDGVVDTLELNLPVESFLPDNIYLADTNDQVAVKITVEPLMTKDITIASNDVALRNTLENMDYEVQISGVYKIRLKGLESDLNDVTKESLDVYLNVDGKTEGSYVVSPSYTKPEGVGVALAGHMTLIVTQKEEVTEEASSEEGSTEEGASTDQTVTGTEEDTP